MDRKVMLPLLLGVVVLLLLYRRARRSFGRQPVSTPRLAMRVGVLCALCGLVVSAIWRDVNQLEALAGGVVAGGLLALLGLRHTRFEATPQGRFYTPHTYIGALVLALFVVRLVFRIATGHADLAALQGTQPSVAAAAYQQNPLTLLLIGLPIGYYVLYNLGVMRRSRALVAPPPDTAGI